MRLQTPEQNYVNDIFPLNDPDLLRIKQKLRDQGLDFMSISASEARILQFLIRGFGVKTVVEVGTLYGYSAIAMAKALPPGGKIVSLEMNQENFDIATAHVRDASVSETVQVFCGDGSVLLPGLEKQGPFDMIFIDANKAAYVDYLNWAEKNVRSGGLIVGDNTFLFGGVYGRPRDKDIPEKAIRVMQEFNRRLADPKKYNSILIPTFEGMTVAQKL